MDDERRGAAGSSDEKLSTNVPVVPNTIFVSGFDMTISEDDLLDIFTPLGPVIDVKIMTYNNGKSRGFGFIKFQHSDDMSRALQLGTMAKGKPLFITQAVIKPLGNNQVPERDLPFMMPSPNSFHPYGMPCPTHMPNPNTHPWGMGHVPFPYWQWPFSPIMMAHPQFVLQQHNRPQTNVCPAHGLCSCVVPNSMAEFVGSSVVHQMTSVSCATSHPGPSAFSGVSPVHATTPGAEETGNGPFPHQFGMGK